MQPEAKMSQLNRNLSFEYKIVPLNGETYGDLLNIQHSLKNADFILVDAVNTDTCTSDEKSYFELDNHEIALSIFKEADDKNGFVVRLFNTSNKPQIAKIKANFDYTKVAETNLLEETVRALEFFDGTLELGPCEIKTFRFY
jgi:alpha-mannosidase